MSCETDWKTRVLPPPCRRRTEFRPESGQTRPPSCRGQLTLCGTARQSPAAGTTAISSDRTSGRSWPNPCKLLVQTSGKTESSRHPARIPKVARCISTKVDRAADIQPPTTWAQRINRPLPARPTRAGSQKVAGGRAQRPPRVTPPTTTAPRRRCQKAWVNRNDATDKSTQSGVRRSRRLLLRSRQRRGAGTPGSHTHLAMTSMRDERSPASTKPNRG